jgi:broad-specificity NMP kinase
MKYRIIGGSPSSGKSSLATELSRDLQIPCYHIDEHEPRHHKIALKNRGYPVIRNYLQSNPDEVWLADVEKQVQIEFEYHKERFRLAKQDLQKMPETEIMILEGVSFLPWLVKELAPGKVIYLLPTYRFQLAGFAKRKWINSILQSTSNPEKAFENWMQRDKKFAQIIKKYALENMFPVFTMDINCSKSEKRKFAEQFFLSTR